jgi:HlyD family secretion protein
MAKRNPLITRLALVGVTVAVLLLIAWLFFYKPPVAVDLSRINRGDVEVTVGDDGIARVREVYEVAAPLAGRLLRVGREVGDPVEANKTVLAQLAPLDPGFLDQRSRSVAQAQLATAQARLDLDEAEVRRAAASEQLARREFSRMAALAQSGIVSRAALDRARTAQDEAIAVLASARAAEAAAQSGIAAARAQLAAPLARDQGGVVAVRSPVSGTVLQLFQKSEVVVQAGAHLVAVGDPKGDLEVVADLVSTDAVRVKPGDRVYVEQWGGSRPLLGRVRLVEPFGFLKVSALGVEEQRVNVRIDLVGDPATWSRLGHGYRVEVRIVTDTAPKVLRVPTSALFRDRDQWTVFVEDRDRARLRHLQLGLMNDRFAEVRGGLREGEAVVLFPAETIRDGTRLRQRS